MRNYFVLDGVSSAAYGTYIATSTMYDAPERDVETIEIPGRNGNLVYDNGRYKNFGATLTCYIPDRMKTNVDALKAFLLSRNGYVRYEDTMHADVYRMVRYTGAFELDNSDRVGASLAVNLDCKPQRWLKSGEQTQAVTSGTTLYNATHFPALPVIRATGNGSITIGDTTITVSGNTGQIYLDCETQNAYLGSINKNNMVTPYFPVLNPGDNTITISGLTDVQITPRWWTL